MLATQPTDRKFQKHMYVSQGVYRYDICLIKSGCYFGAQNVGIIGWKKSSRSSVPKRNMCLKATEMPVLRREIYSIWMKTGKKSVQLLTKNNEKWVFGRYVARGKRSLLQNVTLKEICRVLFYQFVIKGSTLFYSVYISQSHIFQTCKT